MSSVSFPFSSAFLTVMCDIVVMIKCVKRYSGSNFEPVSYCQTVTVLKLKFGVENITLSTKETTCIWKTVSPLRNRHSKLFVFCI